MRITVDVVKLNSMLKSPWRRESLYERKKRWFSLYDILGKELTGKEGFNGVSNGASANEFTLEVLLLIVWSVLFTLELNEGNIC